MLATPLRRTARGWLPRHLLASAAGGNERFRGGAHSGTTLVVPEREGAARWSATGAGPLPRPGRLAAQHPMDLPRTLLSAACVLTSTRVDARRIHSPSTMPCAGGILDRLVLITPARSRVFLVSPRISIVGTVRSCAWLEPGVFRRGWKSRAGLGLAAPPALAPTPPAVLSLQSPSREPSLSSERWRQDPERGEDERPGPCHRAPDWRRRPPPSRRPPVNRTWRLGASKLACQVWRRTEACVGLKLSPPV